MRSLLCIKHKIIYNDKSYFYSGNSHQTYPEMNACAQAYPHFSDRRQCGIHDSKLLNGWICDPDNIISMSEGNIMQNNRIVQLLETNCIGNFSELHLFELGTEFSLLIFSVRHRRHIAASIFAEKSKLSMLFSNFGNEFENYLPSKYFFTSGRKTAEIKEQKALLVQICVCIFT